MNTNENKLIELAKFCHKNRSVLIQKFKSQGSKGNVKIELPYNCSYIYGETIPTPIINFGAGKEITDMELFNKVLWNK